MTPESAIAFQLRRIVDSGGFGQVSIAASTDSFSLRHVDDRDRPDAELQTHALAGLRQLVSADKSTGRFRPLKSAPDLPSGWRHVANDEAGLERALDVIYPGAIADAAAFAAGTARVQPWAEFASRQTGIYKTVAALPDGEIARIVDTCCPPGFCMRHPVWHSGTETNFPCLAPCAVVLEFARFVAGGSKTGSGSAEDGVPAACEFSNPANPRTRYFLDKRT